MSEIDKGRWVLVPVEPTEAMWDAGRDPVMHRDMNFYRPPCQEVPAWQKSPDGTVETDRSNGTTAVHVWRAMVAAAPAAPNDSITAEEARTFQRWAGMDGATAWHLIDRHANGWGDVGRMMDAWLEANRRPRYITDPDVKAALDADMAEMKADPRKAVAFLQSAGILGPDGKLSPDYGGEGATT